MGGEARESRHLGRLSREFPDREAGPGVTGPNPHGKTRHFGRSGPRILDSAAISIRKIAKSQHFWAVKLMNHGTLPGLPVKSPTAQRFLPLRVQIRTVKHVTLAALDPGSSIGLQFLVEKEPFHR